MDKLKAVIKYIVSFRRQRWSLADYPIRIRHQSIGATYGGRRKPIAWSAQIINWYQMGGHGDSEEEALANLKNCFDNYQSSHDTLPRPGTGAPIEYAPSDEVDRHEVIARDFLQRILGLSYDDCIITDESSLWDFHDEDSNNDCLRKIALLYGVDVSDIEGARLGKIFQRISERGRNLTSGSS